MNATQAADLIWSTTAPILTMLGFLAVLLLGLGLIGLVRSW